ETKVRPEDMERALLAINKLTPDDRRDLTARALCLIQLFSEDRPKRDSGSSAAAIDWRFEALSRPAKRPALEPSSFPPDHRGGVKLSPVVLQAAAQETLIVSNDDRPTFDPESFFQRLLALSKEAGQG